MSLLQMSLSGAAMILAILLVRTLALQRLPKRLFPALWWLVLIRLLVPFSLPAPCSVYSLLSRPVPVAVHQPGPVIAPLSPSAWAGEATGTPTAVGGAAASVDPWVALWLAGFLVCSWYFMAVYVKCRREFREALPVHNDYVSVWLLEHRLRRPVTVRQSDRIAAPLTYGILRPVILLPKSTDWDDRETLGCVLAHEWAHVWRFDGLLKLALAAAFCVHWFNPLVWVMLFFANLDIELACDEAVLQQLGQDMRSGYAMALIRMEERRGGPPLIGNYFSKAPIEERIKSIMTIKRKSMIALALSICLIGGTATVFATSASADNNNNNAPQTSYVVENKDAALVSYTDENGTTYYSFDDGETWTAMTDEEFAAAYPEPEVEWWTAAEYAAWLENEKRDLQDMIGSKGWTQSTGWFTWTQEMVDETIAEYEEILNMIESGYLVSKTVDGDENTMLVMNPLDRVVGSADWENAIEAKEQSDFYDDTFDYTSLFDDYKSCGLTFQNSDGNLYWNGQRVRIFVDGAEHEGGWVSQYEHYDPEGSVDVRTIRERVDNGDGSYNLMGPLVRLEEFEPEQMFLEALEGQRYVGAEFQYEAERTAQELKRYEKFGLTFDSNANSPTGSLSMSWNGQPVRSLFDPERQLCVCNSLGTKGLNLEAVYEGGELTGLRESAEDKSFVESGTVINAEATATEGTGDNSGETIAERMEKYAPYGVSYQEKDGKRSIRYEGKAVDSFTDMRPGGGVFSVKSTDGGEIALVTVYDGDGELKGVKAMMSYRF